MNLLEFHHDFRMMMVGLEQIEERITTFLKHENSVEWKNVAA